MTYADSAFWNRSYRERDDTVRVDRWTEPFLTWIEERSARRILDLGCGVGNETVTLLRKGYDVVGLDYSSEAIAMARSKSGEPDRFLVADMAKPLPFQSGRFDAVMSNVAAHMFSDAITRAILLEVERILTPRGLFLFNLNSVEDRPIRAKAMPVVRELEENYILERSGQTMHFFSREYILQLLSGWENLLLEPVEILVDKERDEYLRRVMEGYPDFESHRERMALLDRGFTPSKRVWRGVFQKRGAAAS